MKHQFLEAGRIVRTHGVRGELVLECWADSPEFVAGVKHLYFDGGKTDAGVVSSRVHKGRLLLKLQGVDTVEQGDALRGKVLYLNREDVRLLRQYMQQVLDPREQKVLTLRYGLDGREPLPQREVALQCDISRSYISRIEKKALKKLRAAFEEGAAPV